MSNHGRHRHRASRRDSTQAAAAGGGTSGSASTATVDWFGAPEWSVARGPETVGDADAWWSTMDRAPRAHGRHARGAAETTEQRVPQPRHVTARHAVPGEGVSHHEFDPTQFGAHGPAAPSGKQDGRSPVRHPVKFAIYGAVLAGLVGGAGAWASLDKSVTLSVDGDTHTMHTYAGTVRGVLDGAHITVGQHDLLAPGEDARIKDGSEIVLRHGRLLRLTVDGQTRLVWVTATSVDEALNQIGFSQSGLYVSASRSKRLPLAGMSLEVRTPKTVTIVVDGHTRTVVTTAPSVGEMLEENSVLVSSSDRLSELAAAPVVDGMRITVTRVRHRKVVTRTVIQYKVIEQKDPTLSVGTRKVTRSGVNGLQEVTRMITYLDGRASSTRDVSVRVLARAVDEVVLVGTKQVTVSGSGSVPDYGGLNWSGLAQCESGGDPRAVNPSGQYFGLYQFDLSTWHANGGSGNPIDASPAEQTRIAYVLYQARGRSPWPVCGKYL